MNDYTETLRELALGVFFWLSAILDKDYTKMGTLKTEEGNFYGSRKKTKAKPETAENAEADDNAFAHLE